MFVTWRDCLSCLNELEVGPGHRIAVWGSGGNGLAFVRFAALLGAKVVLVGNPTRFRRAEALGAIACIDYRNEEGYGAGEGESGWRSARGDRGGGHVIRLAPDAQKSRRVGQAFPFRLAGRFAV